MALSLTLKSSLSPFPPRSTWPQQASNSCPTCWPLATEAHCCPSWLEPQAFHGDSWRAQEPARALLLLLLLAPPPLRSRTRLARGLAPGAAPALARLCPPTPVSVARSASLASCAAAELSQVAPPPRTVRGTLLFDPAAFFPSGQVGEGRRDGGSSVPTAPQLATLERAMWPQGCDLRVRFFLFIRFDGVVVACLPAASTRSKFARPCQRGCKRMWLRGKVGDATPSQPLGSQESPTAATLRSCASQR